MSAAQPPAPDGGRDGDRHVVVVADGDAAAREDLDAAWPGWAAGLTDVIAADGGLEVARRLGLAPTRIVGDLDSADPVEVARAAAVGVAVVRSPADKDESDTELALLEATRLGATRVTVLGALGGPRPDHALANVWLLAHPAVASIPVCLLDATSRVSVLAAPAPDGGPARRDLPGPVGGTVSLFPVGGDAEGVTTSGFRYPLDDEPLRTGPARGLSNVRTAASAAVVLRRGRLLIVEIAPPRAGLDSGA